LFAQDIVTLSYLSEIICIERCVLPCCPVEQSKAW